MAAAKKTPAKGKRPPKMGLRGRMPVKRSINLILVDENKISLAKAVPSILLIVLLAFLFSKYMVADRLIAMSRASGQASSIKSTLDQATEALKEYEGIEDTYAHMTYAGMTQEEMSRVDRVQILNLVSTILPQGDYTRSWSVSGNVLTVEITGRSLEYLNELARRIEESPIVDSCAITTAVKNEKQQVFAGNSAGQSLASALENRRREVEGGLVDRMLSAMTGILGSDQSERVQARLTIYLMQPLETDESEAAPQPEATELPPVVGIKTTAKKPVRPEVPQQTAAAQADEAEQPAEDAAQEAQPAEEAVPAASEPEEVSAP